jgi:hypothetical protein
MMAGEEPQTPNTLTDGERSSVWFALLFGVLALAMIWPGTIFLREGVNGVTHEIRSRHFVPITAELRERREGHRITTRYVATGFSSMPVSTKHPATIAEYEYVVEGRGYSHTRSLPLHTNVSGTIALYYDATDPSRTAPERGPSAMRVILEAFSAALGFLLVVGGAVIGIGLFYIAASLASDNRRASRAQ